MVHGRIAKLERKIDIQQKEIETIKRAFWELGVFYPAIAKKSRRKRKKELRRRNKK